MVDPKTESIHVMEESDENDSLLKSTKIWNEINKKMENDINLINSIKICIPTQ